LSDDRIAVSPGGNAKHAGVVGTLFSDLSHLCELGNPARAFDSYCQWALNWFKLPSLPRLDLHQTRAIIELADVPFRAVVRRKINLGKTTQFEPAAPDIEA
jgi:hypothetical protein